ncbi:hypothetical protein [Paraburkholderia antibiotica]|uniref:Uncharacterized protein n=1 Tax=Paraburkholderia antibiotica TaxID=2728839 RepID=A0A7X9ZXX7_9BURK|nr:hypothetical protein [Paraburkholderia antibiotica]NML30788.1 hypothetical protein [Paraburkholderia antibiotica]
MEMQTLKSNDTDWTVEEECGVCRVTYSIYSNFPSMPSAQALNVETGEFFTFDRVRSLPTGYAMAEALGYDWACNCRGRPQKRFDEQFTLRDDNGRLFANVRYRIDTGGGKFINGTTDATGRTLRVRSRVALGLRIYASGAIGNE